MSSEPKKSTTWDSNPDAPEGLAELVSGWIGRLARIVVDMRRQIDPPPEGA